MSAKSFTSDNTTNPSSPKFTIALLRPPPNLSPYHARFLVPLDLGKLDLRDYLFHAYNIQATNIRSYVEQQKVRVQYQTGGRRWRRPRAKKYMTVEMDKPFVWPAEPENWEAWGGKGLRPEGKLDRYNGWKKKEKEENSVKKSKEAQMAALMNQAEDVKRRVENPQLKHGRISFAQGINRPGFKIRV